MSTSNAHERSRSLDLLRALAIALVITAHSVLAYGAPASLAPLQLGGTGVDLFFVLSGWLLGGQLMRELRDTDGLDLRRFWIRRWMRTLPAYYAVLFMTMLEQYVLHPGAPTPLAFLYFGQNYLLHIPYFHVSWSLCVEEHFYLAVAPLLLLTSRIGKWRWPVILVLLLLPATFRFLGWYDTPEETHVRWDGCLLGVALAMCRYSLPNLWARLTRFAPWIAGTALVFYLANYVGRWWPSLWFTRYDVGIYALMFGALLLFAVRNERTQRLLYVPGANFIAVRAYSLYLMHPEVLAILKLLLPRAPFVCSTRARGFSAWGSPKSSTG